MGAVMSWSDEAACRGMDPAIFYPVARPRGRNARYDADWEPARDVCEGCPVSEQCLSYAMERPEREGMWGGLTPDERRVAQIDAAYEAWLVRARGPQ
ncbi:MAG: WhiB family transcriptional regulator [Actinobacteria bacterium]|nr:WhiB family transcriptional regulator [Actinomycetota bacterium]